MEKDKNFNSSDRKYTSEDLKTMQSWSLDRKIQVTQTRIIEWYQRNNGMVYVSFSGGKDSTVLLDIARKIYPDIPAVFIDTGLEYPELRDFVKTVKNVTWLKPKINFRKVIDRFGYPIISKRIAGYVATARNNPNSKRAKYLRGEVQSKMFGFGNGKYYYLVDAPFRISDYCCTAMKESPNKQYAKKTGRKPIVGTMACESVHRRNDWMKNGCNIFDAKEPISKPMSFWTEQDVLRYLSQYHVRYASIYGDIVEDKTGVLSTTGCHRTGCVFCGFGCHLEKEPNRFQQLKVTHPKLWNYCMKPWNEGGLGMKDVLEFIGVKYE